MKHHEDTAHSYESSLAHWQLLLAQSRSKGTYLLHSGILITDGADEYFAQLYAQAHRDRHISASNL